MQATTATVEAGDDIRSPFEVHDHSLNLVSFITPRRKRRTSKPASVTATAPSESTASPPGSNFSSRSSSPASSSGDRPAEAAATALDGPPPEAAVSAAAATAVRPATVPA